MPTMDGPGEATMRRVIAGKQVDAPLYAVGAVGGLYVSHDGGDRWSRANIGLPETNLGAVRVADIAVDPEDDNHVYVSVDPPSAKARPTVYWTTDGGRTWQVRSTLGPRRVRGIAFGPTADDLYMITAGDIFRAFVVEDGERHFVRHDGDLAHNTICSIDPRASVTAFRVVEGSVLDVEGARARADQNAGRSPRTVFVGTQGRGLHIIVDDLVRGPSWVSVNDDPVSTHVREQAAIRALCVHPRDASIICVGTDAGLYMSLDGGVSWKHTAYPLRHEQVLALLLDPSTDTIYAGLAGRGVFYSRDGAVTWERLGTGLRHSVLCLSLDRSGEVLYAATTRGLWKLLRP